PARGRIPIKAKAVTLFPEPDSPTRPRVSPSSIWKETPLTAYTVPRSVQNSTRRSSTSSRAARSPTAAQLRVERLPQSIADQVEPQHGDDDRDAWCNHEVWRALEVAVAPGQHRAPFRCRRILRPQAEEAEACHVDDRRRHRKGRRHDHG